MEGFISLDRKIILWEWYNDANTLRVFLHLLLLANHTDGNFKGVPIKRGQRMIGRDKLSKELHLSAQAIRTALKRLQKTNEITIKATTKYSIVTICKYDSYQDTKKKNNQHANQPITNKTTNEQPTTNQQLTINNNDNKENNDYKNSLVKISEKKEKNGTENTVFDNSVQGQLLWTKRVTEISNKDNRTGRKDN